LISKIRWGFIPIGKEKRLISDGCTEEASGGFIKKRFNGFFAPIAFFKKSR